MFSVSVFLLTLLLLTSLTTEGQQFGPPVTDKTTDVLFRDMGQAYVSNFGIVDTDANLQVVLEDTIGVDEFWVVDFQPYDKSMQKLPVNINTGDIEPENTGECSNVIIDGPFSSILGSGRYFQDDSNFRTINVSLHGPGGNGDMIYKRLFEHYLQGKVYNDTDQYGDRVQRRDDVILFQDDFGYFFNCTDTDGELIWRYSNTSDSVEYRTTMYITNVRLRERPDPDEFMGVSWVMSSVDLLYRIYRVAIVNFVLSSSALVQPTLNYVIIKPYPPDVPEPTPAKAWIKMEFETLVDSPSGELLGYVDQSLIYTSREEVATLDTVLIESDSSTGKEGCILVNNQCRQTWTFYLVLDVTVPLPLDDSPIDVTGTFDFDYVKYDCNDATANTPSDCTPIPGANFTISLNVTIQTVVSLLDEFKDEPTIVLKSIAGANGEDLRGGSVEGRRGVNHQEAVAMIVGYEPEVLHKDFDLQLTLFMVCKQNETAMPGGCLDADVGDRYVAYYHNDFQYIHTPDEGEPTTYTLTDISEEWDPLADESSKQQTLTTYQFDSALNEYTIGFTNTALSQERLTYTITSVYKLVYVSGRRRRREIGTQDKQILIKTSLIPYGDTHSRKRRDLLEAATYPQAHTVMLDFVGCPSRSTYNSSTLNCDCPDGEIYSTRHYECFKPDLQLPLVTEPMYNLEDDVIETADSDDRSSAAPLRICFALHFIVLLMMYCFTYLKWATNASCP